MAGAATLRVTPVSVESLGDEKHLLLPPPDRRATGSADLLATDEASAAGLWTAKAGPHAELVIGREVSLTVDLTAAYFFDVDTGAAISASPRTAANLATAALRSVPEAPLGSR